MQRLEGTDKVLVLSFYTDFMDFMDFQLFTVSLHILSFFTTRHKNNLNIYLPKIKIVLDFFFDVSEFWISDKVKIYTLSLLRSSVVCVWCLENIDI